MPGLSFSRSASIYDPIVPASAVLWQRLLSWGNRLMALGGLMTLASVWSGYVLADHLSLLLQGLSHVSALLWAVLIKFGFIMRLSALNRKQLGSSQP